MRSSIVKRSVVIAGRKTSVSLEDIFWSQLKDIAHGRKAALSKVVGEIKAARGDGNLSSAIRVFVLESARVRVPMFAGSAVEQQGLNGGGNKTHV